MGRGEVMHASVQTALFSPRVDRCQELASERACCVQRDATLGQGSCGCGAHATSQLPLPPFIPIHGSHSSSSLHPGPRTSSLSLLVLLLARQSSPPGRRTLRSISEQTSEAPAPPAPPLGSMDDKVKKPLPLSAMKKKLPPSFLAKVRVFSLLAALAFACSYGGLAAYNLRGRSCHPRRFVPCYRLTGADAIGEAAALQRGVLWCAAPQAAAAALALVLLGGCGRGRRALAFVALAATAANHWMYARLLGLVRVDAPGDLFLAVETVIVFFAAVLDLLGFLAFVLGGDE